MGWLLGETHGQGLGPNAACEGLLFTKLLLPSTFRLVSARCNANRFDAVQGSRT